MLDYEEFDNMVDCIMVTALLECLEFSIEHIFMKKLHLRCLKYCMCGKNPDAAIQKMYLWLSCLMAVGTADSHEHDNCSSMSYNILRGTNMITCVLSAISSGMNHAWLGCFKQCHILMILLLS